MHKYMFFSALCFADWFQNYIHVLKQLLKLFFLEKKTDLISVKLPNFKVIIGTIIAFLW